MIIPLFLIILLCLWGISFSRINDYSGYLSRERTNSIKGIFIVIVFLSHINGYLRKSGYEYDTWGDSVFSSFLSLLGQLMVVMFLFYSGYGVMESISGKGVDYVKAMPRHRILNTLLNFEVAVCAFLVVDLLLEQEVTIHQLFLSLIAWDSLGNSNWYIFAVLICYIVTWVIACNVKNKKFIGEGVLLIISIVALGLYFVKESWWYNTLWAYPTGIIYSSNRHRIENYANNGYIRMLSILIVGFAIVFCFPYGLAGFKMNTLSILFSLLIVIITMRVKIDNPVLKWCGANLFPLYIYQRIPMLVLYTIIPSKYLVEYPLTFLFLCLLIVILITHYYRYVKINL